MNKLMQLAAASGQALPKSAKEGELKLASFTLLELHMNCPYSAYLRSTQSKRGEKQEQNPAAERGSNIHDWIEKYIKGELKVLPKDVKHQRDYITQLHSARNESGLAVQMEEKWYFNREFAPCQYPERRILIKQDVFYFTGPNAAVCDDWKTGRRNGNEAKHARQLQFYAVSGMMRYPELEHITVSARYTDENSVYTRGYTREQVMPFFRTWNNKLQLFWADTTYMPKPNRINCKNCPYNKPNADGEYACEHGVRDA